MTDKMALAEGLTKLTDEALAAETARAAAEMASHHEKFAHELLALSRPPEAARRCGLSDKGGSPYDTARREDVQHLVALLREGARRRAAVSQVGQIQRVQGLSVKAEEKGDLPTALAAEKEVSKLAGIYPESGTGTSANPGTFRLEIHYGAPLPAGEALPALPEARSELETFAQSASPLPPASYRRPASELSTPPASRAVLEAVASPINGDDDELLHMLS